MSTGSRRGPRSESEQALTSKAERVAAPRIDFLNNFVFIFLYFLKTVTLFRSYFMRISRNSGIENYLNVVRIIIYRIRKFEGIIPTITRYRRHKPIGSRRCRGRAVVIAVRTSKPFIGL